MKYERFDTVEFDNGKKYVVVDSIKYNDNLYLYLANEDESKDYVIVKEGKDDNQEFSIIEDEEILTNVSRLITEKNKEIIDFLLNNQEQNN